MPSGPVVHTLLSDFKCQQQVPEMYLDVLSRSADALCFR
ncbi:alpha/beta hydrolase [Escherichia coli]